MEKKEDIHTIVPISRKLLYDKAQNILKGDQTGDATESNTLYIIQDQKQTIAVCISIDLKHQYCYC